MLVVYMSSTKAVLGAASRRAMGEPAVEDIVGAALPLRASDMESGVAVAAADLAVKEVDYSDDVFRQPLNHGLDTSDAVVLVSPTLTATSSSSKVTVTMSVAPAADKSVVIVIDAGSNRDPLKFTAKTTTLATLDVPVTGVPPGSHDALISVDGYVSLIQNGSF
jgi:hypothetical protein